MTKMKIEFLTTPLFTTDGLRILRVQGELAAYSWDDLLIATRYTQTADEALQIADELTTLATRIREDIGHTYSRPARDE